MLMVKECDKAAGRVDGEWQCSLRRNRPKNYKAFRHMCFCTATGVGRSTKARSRYYSSDAAVARPLEPWSPGEYVTRDVHDQVLALMHVGNDVLAKKMWLPSG